MKAAEITDVVLESIRGNRHKFIRINYPNGDMVGHTGHVQAVEISVEATDLCVGRLMEAIAEAGGAGADGGPRERRRDVRAQQEGRDRDGPAHRRSPRPRPAIP
jgi:2,3-bisphosphoglycerate-independent phosphoglycerate mutase